MGCTILLKFLRNFSRFLRAELVLFCLFLCLKKSVYFGYFSITEIFGYCKLYRDYRQPFFNSIFPFSLSFSYCGSLYTDDTTFAYDSALDAHCATRVSDNIHVGEHSAYRKYRTRNRFFAYETQLLRTVSER